MLYLISNYRMFNGAWKVVLCYAPLKINWTSLLEMDLWKWCDFVQILENFSPNIYFSYGDSFKLYEADCKTWRHSAESWKRCVDEMRGKAARKKENDKINVFFCTICSRQTLHVCQWYETFQQIKAIWNIVICLIFSHVIHKRKESFPIL